MVEGKNDVLISFWCKIIFLTMVSGTINGSPFEMEVPEKGPIVWEKPPFSEEE
jgi:hypothetical protein